MPEEKCLTSCHYEFVCSRWIADLAEPDRLVEEEVWRDEFDNLVTNVGKDKALDMIFVTGSGGTPAWYVGLKNTGSPAAGDTMSSHAGWTENTGYSESTRPQWVANGVPSGQSVSNSSSVAAFSINAGGTIYGAFLCNDSTKGGTSGVLLSVGDFASPRTVANLDTLNVTVTASQS